MVSVAAETRTGLNPSDTLDLSQPGGTYNAATRGLCAKNITDNYAEYNIYEHTEAYCKVICTRRTVAIYTAEA